LLEGLARLSSRRLGLYYEALWQFALRQAPGIELLAANLAIRDGGHTLGELDMLLRDRDGVHHLELAIKLYLGPSTGEGSDPPTGLGLVAMTGWDRNWRTWRSTSCPCRVGRTAVRCWTRWAWTRCRHTCGWAVICSIPWPARRRPPSGSNPEHLRGAGCTGGTGPRPGAALAAPAPACLAGTGTPGARDCLVPQFQAWLAGLDAHAPAQLLARMAQQADGAGKK
jgi:hypothetical protein